MIVSPQGFVTTFAPGAGELAGHGGDRSKRQGSTRASAPSIKNRLLGRLKGGLFLALSMLPNSLP